MPAEFCADCESVSIKAMRYHICTNHFCVCVGDNLCMKCDNE